MHTHTYTKKQTYTTWQPWANLTIFQRSKLDWSHILPALSKPTEVLLINESSECPYFHMQGVSQSWARAYWLINKEPEVHSCQTTTNNSTEALWYSPLLFMCNGCQMTLLCKTLKSYTVSTYNQKMMSSHFHVILCHMLPQCRAQHCRAQH